MWNSRSRNASTFAILFFLSRIASGLYATIASANSLAHRLRQFQGLSGFTLVADSSLIGRFLFISSGFEVASIWWRQRYARAHVAFIIYGYFRERPWFSTIRPSLIEAGQMPYRWPGFGWPRWSYIRVTPSHRSDGNVARRPIEIDFTDILNTITEASRWYLRIFIQNSPQATSFGR